MSSVITDWVSVNLPSHQQIESRAYQNWQERGEPWGTPEEDWLKAETELTSDVENALTGIARTVGTAVGNVMGLLTDH